MGSVWWGVCGVGSVWYVGRVCGVWGECGVQGGTKAFNMNDGERCS